MNLQDFINNATELAHTIIESGLYQRDDSQYQAALEILKSPADAEKLIEEHDQSMRRIAIIWSANDIVDRANEIDYPVTDEDAECILDQLKHNHDCTIGVNWDVIDELIRTAP